MLIENEIDQIFLSAFEDLSCDSTQFIAASGADHTEDMDVDSVVVVATAMRSNDAFSLPMISVPVAISIVTRIERDKTREKHNALAEKIVNKLSYWHKFADEFGNTFTTESFLAGEIYLQGGTNQFDQSNRVWSTLVNCQIRGSEKF